jgi:G3E family GTPase
MPIAQAFHTDQLLATVRLEAIVTVVDAASFWTAYESNDLIEDDDGNPVEAPLAPLLVDQLEYTDIVILNKLDIALADNVERLERFVRALNPEAEVKRAERGAVDPGVLLGTPRYRYDLGPESAGWDETWDETGAMRAESEADAYGFRSIVYRRDVPLLHSKFEQLYDIWPSGILRAKGFIAFADHPPVLFSQAFHAVELAVLRGPDGHDHELEGDALVEVPGEVDEFVTELVFIGQQLDEDEIVSKLDGCLALLSATTGA